MKSITTLIVLASVVFASGCVHRTIMSQPGFTSPSGEPYEIPPAHQKLVEDRIVWVWQGAFWHRGP